MASIPDKLEKATIITTDATPSGEDKASHAARQQETKQSSATPVADDGVKVIGVRDSAATAPNAMSDVDTILTNALAGDLHP